MYSVKKYFAHGCESDLMDVFFKKFPPWFCEPVRMNVLCFSQVFIKMF